MAENNREWQERQLPVKKWRRYNNRWYQLVLTDTQGKERFFIMKEVKELRDDERNGAL